MPSGQRNEPVKMSAKPERRAPKGGYDFDAKTQYREQVWAAFAANAPKPLSECKVLILPSKEGLEIPIAIRLGVREENIFAVDENAALIATAPWRKAYPAVRFYGNELARACERISAEGHRIDIANLDLCGNLSEKTIRAIKGSACVFSIAFVASVTLLKGRVSPEFHYMVRQAFPEIGGALPDRLEVAFSVLCRDDVFRRTAHGSEYRSGTSTMIWGICSYAGDVRGHRRIVELFEGGMQVAEIAALLKISDSIVRKTCVAAGCDVMREPSSTAKVLRRAASPLPPFIFEEVDRLRGISEGYAYVDTGTCPRWMTREKYEKQVAGARLRHASRAATMRGLREDFLRIPMARRRQYLAERASAWRARKTAECEREKVSQALNPGCALCERDTPDLRYSCHNDQWAPKGCRQRDHALAAQDGWAAARTEGFPDPAEWDANISGASGSLSLHPTPTHVVNV